MLQFQPTSSRKTLIMLPVSHVCWSLDVFAVRSLRMLTGMSEGSIWRWKSCWVIYHWLRGLSLESMWHLLTYTDKSQPHSRGTRGTFLTDGRGICCCDLRALVVAAQRGEKWQEKEAGEWTHPSLRELVRSISLDAQRWQISARYAQQRQDEILLCF